MNDGFMIYGLTILQIKLEMKKEICNLDEKQDRFTVL